MRAQAINMLVAVDEQSTKTAHGCTMNEPLNLALLAPPKRMLERFSKIKLNNDTRFLLSIYDKHGHTYSGELIKYDSTQEVLFLKDNDNHRSVLFLAAEHISSLRLHDVDNHLETLTGQPPLKQKTSDCDIESYIGTLQEMLKQNCGFPYKFTIYPSNTANTMEIDNFRSVLEMIGASLVEISKDDFGLEVISSISNFELEHSKESKFSLKRNNATIKVRLDFSSQLPIKIASLIENAFNKVL